LWAELIDAGDQEGNTKWPAHHGILVMYTFTKAKCKVAHCLCDALDLDAFIIGERVILGSDASVINHRPRVGRKAGHSAT
jgi:hypothetical protein